MGRRGGGRGWAVPTLRVTQGIAAVRRWVDSRGGWPCRRLDGGLAVGFHGDICRGVQIGWDEFEVNFCAGRLALAYDDTPAGVRCFIGRPPEARRFAADPASRTELAHFQVPAPARAAGR